MKIAKAFAAVLTLTALAGCASAPVAPEVTRVSETSSLSIPAPELVTVPADAVVTFAMTAVSSEAAPVVAEAPAVEVVEVPAVEAVAVEVATAPVVEEIAEVVIPEVAPVVEATVTVEVAPVVEVIAPEKTEEDTVPCYQDEDCFPKVDAQEWVREITGIADLAVHESEGTAWEVGDNTCNTLDQVLCRVDFEDGSTAYYIHPSNVGKAGARAAIVAMFA